MRRLQQLPFYPFLFALYPVIALYVHNVTETPLRDAWRSFGLSLAGCALIFGVLCLLTRSPHRAGLSTSLWMLLFFSFGHVYYQLHFSLPAGSLFAQSNVLLAVWMVLMILGGWALLRLLRGPHNLTPILNTVAAAAIIISTLPLANYVVSNRRAGEVSLKNPPDQRLQAASGAAAGKNPDIYYIIVDGYGRSDVLQEFYGVDNTPFIEFLQHRGFQVTEASRTNYWKTSLSVASSLNYHYLDDLLELRDQATDPGPLFELVRHSAVRRYLESQGYRTVAFATGFDFTELRDAEVYYRSQTPYNAFEYNLLMGSMAIFWLDWAKPVYHRQAVLYQFDNLGEAARLEGPKFVFAHMVIPHAPFVFDENGGPAIPMGTIDGNAYTGGLDHYLKGYRGQVQYTSILVEQVIDQILQNSAAPPVIILQSDHGPGAYLDWMSADTTCLRERFGILNALYLPGQDATKVQQLLPQDLTPVNNFRVVLNLYFGENLPMLPNRHYVATQDQIYHLIDVTGRVDTCTAPAYSQP